MENYDSFDDYVEGEYTQVPSNTFDDLYRDVSGNLWTIANLKAEYYYIQANKTFNYSEMLRKCGVEL
jgi:hypothetical protein